MKPSNEIIGKFQRIYFEEFEEEISKEEAYEKFLKLVNLLRAILKPTSEKGQEPKNPDPVSFGFDQHSQSDKLKKYHL